MCNLNKCEAYYGLIFLSLSVSDFQWLVSGAHKDIVVFLLNSTKKKVYLLQASVYVRSGACVSAMKDREKEIANKSNWWHICGFWMVIPFVYPSGRCNSDNQLPTITFLFFQRGHRLLLEHPWAYVQTKPAVVL